MKGVETSVERDQIGNKILSSLFLAFKLRMAELPLGWWCTSCILIDSLRLVQ